MPDISLRSACLTFKNKVLFDHLNIEFKQGEWTCILGASGVGKSSLLRLLANLAPQDYTHYQADILTSDQLPLQNRVAYMAQKDLLLPWFSVLDNVIVGARLRNQSLDLARNKAKKLLAEVGLEQAVDLKPQALSGGMRQRVALARTLFEDKQVVLMDEPFSALDAVTKYRLQNLAAEKLKGRTVVLVTHDPQEALRLGHRIYVLSGSPANIALQFALPSATPRDAYEESLLDREKAIFAALLTG
jgi:putative hydroxymethylpyrimidine transport system ATP-binding protein